MTSSEFPPPKEHRFEEGKYLYWLYLINEDSSEWWKVRNIESGKEVSCSSKLACEKVIRLCKWLEEKPLKHSILERKARSLI